MANGPDNEDGPEVIPEMVKTGVQRLEDLLEAETSSAYVAREVFLAMTEASPRYG